MFENTFCRANPGSKECFRVRKKRKCPSGNTGTMRKCPKILESEIGDAVPAGDGLCMEPTTGYPLAAS